METQTRVQLKSFGFCGKVELILTISSHIFIDNVTCLYVAIATLLSTSQYCNADYSIHGTTMGLIGCTVCLELQSTYGHSLASQHQIQVHIPVSDSLALSTTSVCALIRLIGPLDLFPQLDFKKFGIEHDNFIILKTGEQYCAKEGRTRLFSAFCLHTRRLVLFTATLWVKGGL